MISILDENSRLAFFIDKIDGLYVCQNNNKIVIILFKCTRIFGTTCLSTNMMTNALPKRTLSTMNFI